MYKKMIYKNIKKSWKDYLIYVITLTLCVAIYYAFLSICSSYYHPNIGAEYSMSWLAKPLIGGITAVTLTILFLIRYVNQYMFRKKQKEFGVMNIIGVEKKQIAKVFFYETLSMGIIALVIGVLLGTILSQFINMILMHLYNQEYKIFISLFPDTVLITVIFFLMAFFVIGFTNNKMIKKYKIIYMLQADKKTEVRKNNNIFSAVLYVLYVLVDLYFLLHSYGIWQKYYDTRYHFTVRLMYNCNLILPICFLVVGLFIFIYSINKRKLDYLLLQINLFINGVVNTVLGIFFIENTSKYRLAITTNEKNLYLVFMILSIILSTFAFFLVLSKVIVLIKERSIKIRYKDTNLFLFGQLTAKLRSSEKTTSLICLSLTGALILSIMAPIIGGWAVGFLDKRCIYDIQVSDEYRKLMDIEDLQQPDYSYIYNFMDQEGIEPSDVLEFQTYFLQEDDFYKRNKYAFPILCMPVSDYNKLRAMKGEEVIQLNKGEFTTQWGETVAKKDINQFVNTHEQIKVGDNTLSIAKTPTYQVSLTEYIYNDYADLVYIVPDEACNNLQDASHYLYINTKDTISYNSAKKLENSFDDKLKEKDFTEESSSLRVKTSERNQIMGIVFVMEAIMLYGAVILLIICFTILALQQLTDSTDFNKRFVVLRKLAVSQESIRKVVKKQMAFWFGIPVILSILTGGSIVFSFFQCYSEDLLAYVGSDTLMTNVVFIICAIITILVCYFITTWILFIKNIESE